MRRSVMTLLHGSIGRANWNVAPRSALRETHTRPRCASTIERQIDSPIPIPSDLGRKKSIEQMGFILRIDAGPESCTATSTWSASCSATG